MTTTDLPRLPPPRHPLTFPPDALPRAVTVEFQAAPADVPAVINELVAQLAATLPGGGRPVSLPDGDGGVAHVVLPGGAAATVAVAPTANPRSRPDQTCTATVVLTEIGGLSRPQVRALLAAAQALPFTTRESRTLRAHMPLTIGLPNHLPPGALAGVAPLLTVHHLTDFLVMVEAITAMGVPAEAITVVDKGYAYRLTHRVDAHLRRTGITVYP